MSFELETVSAQRQLEEFVKLPFSIHSPDSPWVPPLIKQDISLLSPEIHPFWQTARRKLFLLRDGSKPVGRIAAIVDDKYNEYAQESCGAFGFFECANEKKYAHALLDHAKEWLVAQGMTFMRGPLNPSANYSCGLLVDGFEEAPTLMMPWNPSYYPELLESWKLRKEEDLFAYAIRRDGLELPDWLTAEISRLKAEGRFTCRASSKKTMKGDVKIMLDLYRRSWADNWGFSPLSQAEAEEHVKELTAILDPEFFVLFFHNGEPAAGMVALPDLNPLLKRLNGKIGLTAPWSWWKTRKQLKSGYRIMLFGILPQFRLYGLPLLLLDYMLEKARSKPDFEWVEGSWVLEDNAAIDDLIEDFSGKLTKRYRIYRREIGNC